MTVATIYADSASATAWMYSLVSYADAWGAYEGVEVYSGLDISQANAGVPNNWQISRAFMFFDTSAIPVGATISQVLLYVAITGSGSDSTIIIQNGQPVYPHNPVVIGDYDKDNYSGDGGGKDFEGLGTYTYLTFPLNSTGIGWINKGGMTKLCLRTSHDVNGISTYVGEIDTGVSFLNYGSAYPPYLEITYTTAGVSSYTLRQTDRRGKPISLAEAKAIDSVYRTTVFETQYTLDGLATFTLIPNDRPCDIEVHWAKQYRLWENVYEASGSNIDTMIAKSHTQNTDATANGVRTSLPSLPALGEVYLG